jgi:hypothetical protein
MLDKEYRHSAGGGNMFLDSPSRWLLKYGFDIRDEANARMAMGSAAEFACHAGIMQNLTDDQIKKVAIEEFDKLRDGIVSDERDYVGPISVNFVRGLKEFGLPNSYQHKILTMVDGLEREVIGYTDFGYDDLYVDTKATLRCPSNIYGYQQTGHVRQQSVYSKLTNKKVALLYATPNKFALYHVPESLIERGWTTMFGAWKAIERLDYICVNPEDGTTIIPLNPDSFYWNDETHKIAQAKWRA